MKMFKGKTKYPLRYFFTFIILLSIPLWCFVIFPVITSLSEDFYYEAEIISVDNFYDEREGEFLGDELSISHFFYEAVQKQDDILIVKNRFDVRKISGETIFSAERLYGIDPLSGRHVPGYGDQDRHGYLISPKNLDKRPYTIWFIGYSDSLVLQYKKEDQIEGLKVYVYEGEIIADNTRQLTHLPGVPEEMGVEVEGKATYWIEPITGYLVKYKDEATNYYYDQETKERLYPKNEFSNKYSRESVHRHVTEAKKLKQKTLSLKWAPPALLLALAFLSVARCRWRYVHFFCKHKRKWL